MDIALLNKGRNRAWFDTMVNMEARRLITEASRMASFHLHDGLTRIKFTQEMSDVVQQQFALARKAKTDDECMTCIKVLRAERESLIEQEKMLRMKTAKLYARVDFVRENNKIVGYVISGVKIVLAGAQGTLGFALTASMTPIGVLAGAILVVDSVNTITREVGRQFLNEPETQGIFGDGAMNIAEFMGFERSTGLGIYNGVALAGNIYSVYGLMTKPGTRRLFNYLSTDFYRKVDTMSRSRLTMKVLGWGVNAKVVFELMTKDDAGT